MLAAIRVVSSSGSVNGTRGLAGAMSRSSKPGKKHIEDQVVTQGGRGPLLLVVVVYVNLYSAINSSFVDPVLSTYDNIIASKVSCSSFIGKHLSECVWNLHDDSRHCMSLSLALN